MSNETPLVERLRALEIDHEPDGWPAVRMRDISALLDDYTHLQAEVERLREERNAFAVESEERMAEVERYKANARRYSEIRERVKKYGGETIFMLGSRYDYHHAHGIGPFSFDEIVDCEFGLGIDRAREGEKG